MTKLLKDYPDLVKALNSTSNITVFAPTDRAFEKIPDHAPKPSKEVLKAILSYHVSPDFYPAGRIFGTHTAGTIAAGGRPVGARVAGVAAIFGLVAAVLVALTALLWAPRLLPTGTSWAVTVLCIGVGLYAMHSAMSGAAAGLSRPVDTQPSSTATRYAPATSAATARAAPVKRSPTERCPARRRKRAF